MTSAVILPRGYVPVSKVTSLIICPEWQAKIAENFKAMFPHFWCEILILAYAKAQRGRFCEISFFVKESEMDIAEQIHCPEYIFTPKMNITCNVNTQPIFCDDHNVIESVHVIAITK